MRTTTPYSRSPFCDHRQPAINAGARALAAKANPAPLKPCRRSPPLIYPPLRPLSPLWLKKSRPKE